MLLGEHGRLRLPGGWEEGFLEEVTAKPRHAEHGGVSQTRAQLVLVPEVRGS